MKEGLPGGQQEAQGAAEEEAGRVVSKVKWAELVTVWVAGLGAGVGDVVKEGLAWAHLFGLGVWIG